MRNRKHKDEHKWRIKMPSREYLVKAQSHVRSALSSVVTMKLDGLSTYWHKRLHLALNILERADMKYDRLIKAAEEQEEA